MSQSRPQEDDYFLLENVDERLLAGEAVEVTFRFSDGTEVTADLPIVPPNEPVDREYYEPDLNDLVSDVHTRIAANDPRQFVFPR